MFEISNNEYENIFSSPKVTFFVLTFKIGGNTNVKIQMPFFPHLSLQTPWSHLFTSLWICELSGQAGSKVHLENHRCRAWALIEQIQKIISTPLLMEVSRASLKKMKNFTCNVDWILEEEKNSSSKTSKIQMKCLV